MAGNEDASKHIILMFIAVLNACSRIKELRKELSKGSGCKLFEVEKDESKPVSFKGC